MTGASKFTHKLYRNVDQKAVPNAQAELRKLGVNDVDNYLKPKYELAVAKYKEASNDAKLRKVLDAVITTKPGSPTLEIK